LGYATPSDPLLGFMLYSGAAVFLLTIVLLAAIAVLRYTIDRREGLERALSERWQPVFFHAVEGLPFEAPRIHGRDREIILLTWIHFTESIRGEARLRLRQLALDLQLEGTALKMLARRNIRLRQMAVVALGRMNSAAAWDQLARLAVNPKPVLSLLAARSLLQIDAGRAVPIMLGELIRRDDWPLVKVATMLREVPPEVLAPALTDALHAVTPQNAPRLLSLLETVPLGDTWPAVAPLLCADQPTEVIVAALKAGNDPRAIDAVRSLATHPQWIVRAQAAAALGRLGGEQDSERLQAMLGDPEWWVRYRAGMALVQLPFVSRQALTDLCGQLHDRFAADMLRQVLAETAPGAEA
jgi:HEAT repeat protein